MGQAVVIIRRDDAGRERLHFEASFPRTSKTWEAQLPTWRPGRYELGNFAKGIYRMEGRQPDGRWIRLKKVDLHRWSVPSGVNTLRWTVDARTLDAGSTCVDPSTELMYVNPVNCMVYDVQRQHLPYRIELPDVPSDWPIATQLPWTSNALQARDVQHLMDSPWMTAPELGHMEYEVDGVAFHLWAYGDTLPDSELFLLQHIRFTQAQMSYFGSFPVESYHFLYLFPERQVRHGVEHEASTVIALGPSELTITPAGFDEIIGIASHELYHTWNVKRIRPVEWMPYDFTQACPSELGYIAEGVTTYMGDLFLFEGGCVDLQGWCRLMERLLDRHLNNPGRLNMSVAASSYDTWLDGYEPGAPGRKGSIYVEGAVLAFLCDVRIMTLTNGNASLSTAMKTLWERFGKDSIGITAENYWFILNETAGTPGALTDLRERFCEGCEDTWASLVESMALQGLELSRTLVPETGLQRTRLEPHK